MARGVRLAATTMVAAAVVAGMPRAASAADDTFRITDDRVTESSGLALSRAHPHTVWTVNDSGDTARVFAVDTRTGRTVGVHRFGAPVRDVEALAIDAEGRMLVGDIGDNTGSRELVRVFWFDEPALGETSGGWASWELAYPDGPHDAEALAVHPLTGRAYLVTKGRQGGIYALPPRPSRQGVNRLERIGPAPSMVTDAVFLPDGSGLVVRTYTHALLLDGETFLQVASDRLPLQPQGETVTVAPGGDSLLVGSEGRRSVVQRVPLPARVTPSSRPPALPGRDVTVEVRETPLDFSHLRAEPEPSPAERVGDVLLGPAGVAVGLLCVGALVVLLRRTRRDGSH
ncbi:hypothetical protein P0Y31_16615 [Knoellia sp. 3-2P3]|uniref:hypothetical protein n=1 Tax=unclassified Knoellia TaxID=2618719 RepID=UPI0023DC4B80|nr:hypothetical protein [Knoellia sp. 3-2P3]MDF2093975.1 hypothetical protein [Knoellia sp. 3-2P3]